MRTLRLSLQEIDENGLYSSVHITIPVSGDPSMIGKLLEMSYIKLSRDLEKTAWKGVQEN